MVGAVAERSGELIREICKSNEIEIVKGHLSQDHIHLFVSVPSKLSISKLMLYIKGKPRVSYYLSLSIYSDSFGVSIFWRGTILQ
ncbi:transposase [Fulvivirga maritima]|uniref:transposase n=1 Tax=Fulvivirga maritima TaxID=2904247 RepID=UPI00351F23B1